MKNYPINKFFIGKYRQDLILVKNTTLYPSYLNIYYIFYDIILNKKPYKLLSYNYKKTSRLDSIISNISVIGEILHNKIENNQVIHEIKQRIAITINFNHIRNIGNLILKKIYYPKFNLTKEYNDTLQQNTNYTYYIEIPENENNVYIKQGDKILLYFIYKSPLEEYNYEVEKRILYITHTFYELIYNNKPFNLIDIHYLRTISARIIGTIIYHQPYYDYISTNLYNYEINNNNFKKKSANKLSIRQHIATIPNDYIYTHIYDYEIINNFYKVTALKQSLTQDDI